MFVRKKKNKSGSTSIQIIQKLKRKNKVVKTIGSSFDDNEIDMLYRQAQEALPLMFNQLALFTEVCDTPTITELTNDSIRIIGPEQIFGKIFNHIGFNKIKDHLFKDLAISRITHPGSKLQLSKYLHENHDKNISADKIYYFLDKLNTKYKPQIEDISFSYTKQLLGGRVGIVFYDMTTIYFESSQPDELRIPGFSKDGKHQHPQIFLGLLVGKNGYPIGYDIFEGNTFEGHTLIPILAQFQERFKLDKPIVVADAGLLSKNNIKALEENDYTFILGARIKNESKSVVQKIWQFKHVDGQIDRIDKVDGTTLFVSYSDRRAKKDLSNRQRGLKRLEKNLKAGRLTKNNINNKGYNKYLSMKGDVLITIDYEKFNTDAAWDGLKGYITNTNLSGKQVVENYNNLWKIEKAFRISKTDLKIRPIYHRIRERIEAHICISFVSFVLYKELERTLIESHLNISIMEAIKQIKKMFGIRIKVDTDNFQIIHLKNNETQQRIVDVVEANF